MGVIRGVQCKQLHYREETPALRVISLHVTAMQVWTDGTCILGGGVEGAWDGKVSLKQSFCFSSRSYGRAAGPSLPEQGHP